MAALARIAPKMLHHLTWMENWKGRWCRVVGRVESLLQFEPVAWQLLLDFRNQRRNQLTFRINFRC